MKRKANEGAFCSKRNIEGRSTYLYLQRYTIPGFLFYHHPRGSPIERLWAGLCLGTLDRRGGGKRPCRVGETPVLIDDWERKPHGIGVAKSSHVICLFILFCSFFTTIIYRVFALVLIFFLALFKERKTTKKRHHYMYTRGKSSQKIMGQRGKDR